MFKNDFCLFDQYFSHHIDGKYRIAIAPFVSKTCQFVRNDWNSVSLSSLFCQIRIRAPRSITNCGEKSRCYCIFSVIEVGAVFCWKSMGTQNNVFRRYSLNGFRLYSSVVGPPSQINDGTKMNEGMSLDENPLMKIKK